MDVNDCRRNKQKNLIGYRNFWIWRDQTSVVHQKPKKQKNKKTNKKTTETNETQLIIPHPPSFNDGFILNF